MAPQTSKGMPGIRVVDPKTGSVLTEVELLKIPQGWISGMYVQLVIAIDHSDNAIAVSNEALVFEKSQAYVFRVRSKSDGSAAAPRGPAGAAPASMERAEKVPVQLGLRDGKFTEIKAGLEEFDLVVIEGQGGLADGAPVQVIR